jgi:DNA-binding response OmpR family regulator
MVRNFFEQHISQKGWQSMRILFVSDQKSLSRALLPPLEEEGYTVDLATEVNQADVQAREASHDLILLALLMRRETMMTLLRRWRKIGLSAHIVVLLASQNLQDRLRCLDLGADGYMTLPIHPQELLARLRALARRQEVKEPILRIHDLEINRAAHTVKRCGQFIRLTPREFALLQFLATHQGRVVSRSMIWDHLYDTHSLYTSNVVDVYIRYLRLKIDKGFDPPLILTRWGEGYLLRGESA